MRALVIPADKAEPVHELDVPEEDALSVLQKQVGGMIQAVPLPNFIGDGHKATAYINEEGKFDADCPPNMRATDFFVPGVGLFAGDYIAGNCVIVGFNPADGKHRDVPPLTERRIRLIEEEASL